MSGGYEKLGVIKYTDIHEISAWLLMHGISMGLRWSDWSWNPDGTVRPLPLGIMELYIRREVFKDAQMVSLFWLTWGDVITPPHDE